MRQVLDAVTFYIYPSLPDLQSALRLTGYEWVGGQAYPEIGVVLLAISPSSEAILKMKRDIPHELTHKVLYDLTGPQGYAAQPVWFVEGLASTFEHSPDPAYALALQRAPQDRSCSETTLCHPFPAEATAPCLPTRKPEPSSLPATNVWLDADTRAYRHVQQWIGMFDGHQTNARIGFGHPGTRLARPDGTTKPRQRRLRDVELCDHVRPRPRALANPDGLAMRAGLCPVDRHAFRTIGLASAICKSRDLGDPLKEHRRISAA